MFPRRLGATAAVLIAGMLAGCDGSGTSPPAESAPSTVTTPSTASAPTSTPTGRTTAQNRTAAARAAAEVIRTVPLPTGTRRLHQEPPGWPDTYRLVNYSDRHAYQERWWSTPFPRRDVLEFYVDHHPPGLRHTPGEDPYSDGMGAGGLQGSTDFFPARRDHWRQFSGPALVLDVVTVGARTVIHGYTQTSARYARTPASRITADVRSVDVRRTRTDIHQRRHVRRIRLETTTDAGSIARLVRTFNALAGSTTSPGSMMCPISEIQTYRVRFDTVGGVVTARVENTYCDGQIKLGRNGSRLPLTLSPVLATTYWPDVLDRVLRRS
jgi:hypothetical protein